MGLRKDSGGRKPLPEPSKINIGDARYALHFGSYASPRVKIGQTVKDAIRGDVRIVGFTDSPIMWPIGQTKRAKTLVMFRGLLDAVKRESATAICHHWGVTNQTVSKWRKLLKVTDETEGRVKLRRAYRKAPEWSELVLPHLNASLSDPARGEKIRQARLGVPRPPEVIEAMRQANLGRKLSEAHREKLSAARQSEKSRAQREKLHKSNIGRKHSDETRQNMREAHLRWRAEKAAGTLKLKQVLTEAQKVQMKKTRKRYEKRRRAEGERD